MQHFRGWIPLLLAAAAGSGFVWQTTRRQAESQQTEGQRGRGALTAAASRTRPSSSRPQQLQAAYARLPLSFEENRGQFDRGVRFLARGSGYSLAVSAAETAILLCSPRRHGGTEFTRRRAKGERESGGAGAGGSGERHKGSGPNAERRTPNAVLRMRLLEGDAHARVTGLETLPGKVNYLLGKDPAKWRTNISTYARVRCRAVYPGVDLVYYGNQRQLEYDFIVAPGADPRRIRFGVEGARNAEINPRGDLVLHAAGGDLVQHAPVAYQEVNGRRRTVAAEYLMQPAQRESGRAGEWESGGARTSTGAPRADGRTPNSGHPVTRSPGHPVTERHPVTVSFALGAYDRSRPLVIDPSLAYSTYLGGGSGDGGRGIAVDDSGSAYVLGFTNSSGFPTLNPLQPAPAGNGDAFVAKLSPDGGHLVYSTYLGGSGTENPQAIAVDASGNAAVTGTTGSSDFPVANAILPNRPGGPGGVGEAFVSKLNATGSAFLFSTYLGGSGHRDESFGIAADAAGNSYVAGFTQSGDFPVTPGAFQPVAHSNMQGFVTKFDPTGGLVYSSFLGGSGDSDAAFAIAVDPSGNAYVTGQTNSANFPTTPNAVQRAHAGGFYDAFVTEVNPAGTALVYSTYLGGGADSRGNGGSEEGHGIAADPSGNAYVTGLTDSKSFPTFHAAQPTPGEVFVTKINAGGASLVYSTYLGVGGERANGIAADTAGNAYVTGYTFSQNFPTKDSLQPFRSGTYAFVTKFDPAGDPAYSTLLGGANSGNELGNAIAADESGNAYVTGGTASTDFPTINPIQPALAPQPAGSFDAFISKIGSVSAPPPATHLKVTAPAGVTAGDSFNFTVTALDAANNPVPGYTGTVQFTSTDPKAVLPPDYPFAAADGGAHTFSAVLKTTGNQTLTATDTAAAGIKGSATITVKAGAAARLVFVQQPTSTPLSMPIVPPVRVRVEDAFGNPVTDAAGPVTLAISANPGGGTLGGTTTVVPVNGIATFSPLTIDKPGIGYTLIPSSPDVADPSSPSVPFNITGKPPTHFSVTAPASVAAGVPFEVTVTALDADNQVVTDYAGTARFSSSDPLGLLPANYTFVPADGGTHRFTVTLKTPGSRTISVASVSAPFITGAVTVNVTEPVSYVVTTAADTDSASDGLTSLREAIRAANAHPGLDTISFKIPSISRTIRPLTLLPVITDPVVMDGYTQPGARPNTLATGNDANLLIELSGSLAPAGGDGLTITAGGSTVRGLVINGFRSLDGVNHGAAIRLVTRGGNTVSGCFLGTDPAGAAARPNLDGVDILESPDNLIGGPAPGDANVVSGNGGGASIGIYLAGASATGNVIRGNRIGTNAAGTAAVPSVQSGMEVDFASNNSIGPGNLISGNRYYGVVLFGTTGSVVQGNLIGTSIGGSSAVGNGTGVSILGGSGNTIGGPLPALRNVIAGNAGAGVLIQASFVDDPAVNNRVQGNYIGTKASGSERLGNGWGIQIADSSNNLVGGEVASERNVISGNTLAGVSLSGVRTTGNRIRGNYIGTNKNGNGTPPLVPNGGAGVEILRGTGANLIGGDTSGDGNLISGNGTYGVSVLGDGSTVQGNTIGTRLGGEVALGNAIDGVYIEGANNRIGGTSLLAGNLISGNLHSGVAMVSSGRHAEGNVVQGNRIGTNALANRAIGNTDGVFIVARNNTVGGAAPGARNVISGNLSSGIVLADTGSVVQGNFIGTQSDATAALGNNIGIVVSGPNNAIGGTSLLAGNVISGNTSHGVSFVGAGASRNLVQGNYIGTRFDGSGKVANGGSGVDLEPGAAGNLIGGDTPVTRNVISGNKSSGVRLLGPGGAGNVVQGNFIGLAANGVDADGNENDGVAISTPGNLIGGTTVGARNIISGNAHIGVVGGPGATGSLVQGNYIGTNAAGTGAVGNGIGVGLSGNGIVIGGTAPGAGNLISGNRIHGVGIFNPSTGNKVQGNFIGTNALGDTALPNSYHGVYIEAPGNLIGGTGDGAGNVISGNTLGGIRILGATSNGNLVQGNRIGTNAAGTAPVPNAFGLELASPANTTIGGPAPGAGNLVSGNTGAGIQITGSGTNNVVQGNYIGTNAAGNAALGNGIGVEVASGAGNNRIGGDVPGARNVISANVIYGVAIAGPSTTGNRVQGNFIGTDAAGMGALGNGRAGVYLAAPNNLVGGPMEKLGNLISGNGGFGVQIASEGSPCTVQGNRVGTNADGTAVLPNTNGISALGNKHIIGGSAPGAGNLVVGSPFWGISVSGVGTTVQGNVVRLNAVGVVVNGSDHVIGGTSPGAGNVIAGNSFGGVAVDAIGNGNVRNAIRGNAISGNGGLGIDLTTLDIPAGTAKLNDPRDPDTGANNYQNYPVLTAVTPGAGTVTVSGTLNSVPNANFIVDVYRSAHASPSGFGEGEVYVGSLQVHTLLGSGDQSFSRTFPVPGDVTGQYFTATASRVFGAASYETSEFSYAVYAAPVGAFNARFNFQLGSAPVPAGYVKDDGSPYGLRNGYAYGWSGDAAGAGAARDRNAPNSPDQRYDTLIHMQLFGTFTWEAAVPNGNYRVRVVAGDPGFFDSVYRINVEGVPAVSATPNAGALWCEGTVDVTVSDGRLTLSNAPGAINNKICFVEITGI